MSQRVCIYILERGVLGGYFWLGTGYWLEKKLESILSLGFKKSR
jgi:hypothetical protein